MSFAVTRGVLGMALAVAAPVIRMAFAPALLRRGLVSLVIRIGLELLVLPALPACSLTRPLGAVTLLRNIAPRLEQAAAGRTPPLGHGPPPGSETSYQEIRS